jgi:LysM repeat protein
MGWGFIAVLMLNGCATTPHHAPQPMAPIAVTPGAAFHVVQHGQTLYRIAKSYHVDVNDLMKANGIQNPSQLEVGQKLMIPGVLTPTVLTSGPGHGITIDQARRVIAQKNPAVWRTITVHHSATRQGSAQAFHRDHTRRRMGGLFYHFVIGNGTQTKDGEVEVGWRWKKQVPANRANDIQICLVGDFSKTHVSETQYDSLKSLIVALMEQNHIPLSHIRKHEDVKGRHTECPGRYFPFPRLLSDLKSQ